MSPKKLALLAPFLAACLLAKSSNADATSGPQKMKNKDAFATCMENVDLGAFKNMQFTSCYSDELKHQDLLLNQAFKALKDRITDPSRVDKMVKGQQS